MNPIIRPITALDARAVVDLMREFYNSPAVFTNGSEEIYERNVANCVKGHPYVEGYVFEAQGTICGYAMVAKGYATEFGKDCIWLEDLYIKEAYRSQGFCSAFFEMIQNRYPNAVFRLEVEEENEGAVALYKRQGFDVLPYMEMKKEL